MVKLGRKFQESFRAVTAINAVLQEDSILALRQFHNAMVKFNDEQNQENGEAAEFYAKTSIRAFLGHVDGIGYTLREVVAKSADEVGLSIPARKLAELKERKYDAEADSISDIESRLSTETSIKVATTWFPKLFGSEFRLDTNGEGWRGFKRLIRVRNRFTHPERIEDLFPIAAFPAIQPTIVWFTVQMGRMFADCGSKFGLPQRTVEDVVLEFPYKEASYPIAPIFSEQDTSDVQAVGARTMKYIEFMLTKSMREISRALSLIEIGPLPTLSHRYQYTVRNAVRTLFSEVEARTGAATFFIDAAERRGEIRLSEADRLSLSEGGVEDKLVAVLVIFSREFGNDYIPEKTGELWKCFRGTRFLRDRLTHPKDPSSLKIDTGTHMMLLRAVEYFTNTSAGLHLNLQKYFPKAKPFLEDVAEQTAHQEESTDEDSDD